MAELPRVPEIPDDAQQPAAVKGAAVNAKYSALLDNWKARARDPEEEEKRLRVLADSREDTALATTVARQNAEVAAEAALLQSMQTAYVEVAKTSLDRAITRASFMTGLIAAISTTYVALLGLVYGIGEKPTPLPGKAMIPVVFFGIALVLASFYVAFLRRNVKPRNLLPSGIGGTIADERLKTFLDWVFSGVLDRAWALRTSIVAFGIGVVMMPLPFARVSETATWIATAAGAALLVAWLIGDLAYRHFKIKGEPYVPDPPSAALE
jgi:hypothetical protein